MASFFYTLFVTLLFLLVRISAQLPPSAFYAVSCPLALSIIRTAVSNAVVTERRMGASLLRLHFHDCFVNGCDASVLLEDTETFTGERTAIPNANSLRGFEIIDEIKSELESQCPGIAMLKMGRLSPLTGSNGQIRTNCSEINALSVI